MRGKWERGGQVVCWRAKGGNPERRKRKQRVYRDGEGVAESKGPDGLVRREKKPPQAGQMRLLLTCRWQAVAKQTGRLDTVVGRCWPWFQLWCHGDRA